MIVDVRDARTHLSRILDQVVSGEEVIITKAGRPVARVCPYASAPPERIPGRDRGLFTVPDDFDAPIPIDVIDG